jgi:hypothetical protein
MARTTLDLDPTVVRQLRRRGRQEHKSMGQVASELLAQSLARQASRPADERVMWTSWNLGVPKVDLEDKEAVRRALEEPL